MSILLDIAVSTIGTATLIVADEHTAPRVGSGLIHVLATPVMINLIEAAALNACEHLLPAGHQSLGTRLDISHIAATPVGASDGAATHLTIVASARSWLVIFEPLVGRYVRPLDRTCLAKDRPAHHHRR